MDLLCHDSRLMPHLHLSLQSGDNMILKRMKRRHLEKTIILLSTKKNWPEITFSADIIAGFPTETAEMFKNTISIIDECNIDWIHAFPYSSRIGTPASKMPQIPKEEIEKELRYLEKSTKVKKHLNKKLKYPEGLVERNAKGLQKITAKYHLFMVQK